MQLNSTRFSSGTKTPDPENIQTQNKNETQQQQRQEEAKKDIENSKENWKAIITVIFAWMS